MAGFAAATGAFTSGFAAGLVSTAFACAGCAGFGAAGLATVDLATAGFASVGFATTGFATAGLEAVGFAAEGFATEGLAAVGALTEGLTVEALAGGFAVLLGITLLFFEDLSVDIAFDGFGFAILADEVLAAGLLAAVLPVDDVGAAAFFEAVDTAAVRARLTRSLSL